MLAGTLLLLIGCGPAHEPTTDAPVTIAYRSLVSSLDPISENTVISNSLYSNVFEPLVRRDRAMKIAPALAVEWASPDDRTWVFRLRPDVLFHDGARLRPQDVRFSLERARGDPSSTLSGLLTVLARVEVAGPDTVRIVTRKPCSTLLNRLAEIWILPEGFFAQQRSSFAVPGTGPYRVTSWKKGEFVLLERNARYWGEAPPVPRVRFEAVSDLRQRLVGLTQSRIDLLPLLEPSALEDPSLRQGGNVVVKTVPGLTVLYLAMDVWRDKTPYVDRPGNPFRDARVRKAIYNAVDATRIVREVMKGRATPATQLVAPKVLGYNRQIKRLEHDPEAARTLLKQAGYADGFRVRLDVTNNRYQNDLQIGQAIVRDLQAVGIQARLNPVDKDTLLRMRDSRDTSFYMAGWIDGSADSGSLFDFLVHSRDPARAYGTSNGGGYSNPEVDRLIEESSGEMAPFRRIALLERAMQLTMEDGALIPLHVEHNITALSARLQWEPRSDELLFANTIRLQRR
jgi:peptide/nickel transport system substrate-binding protein